MSVSNSYRAAVRIPDCLCMPGDPAGINTNVYSCVKVTVIKIVMWVSVFISGCLLPSQQRQNSQGYKGTNSVKSHIKETIPDNFDIISTHENGAEDVVLKIEISVNTYFNWTISLHLIL